MLPRRATVSLLYNGVNATGQIAGYINSFEYKDVASGASDTIRVSVNDPDKMWIGPWFPVKGDRLVPTILLHNWMAEGQIIQFPCGAFKVDDFGFSGGPIKMNLDAIALPSSSSFKTEDRTETYEKATLQQIGQLVAGRAGISLFFDATDVAIEKVEQNKQNDCDFYNGLVEKYGLSLKIYNDRLVVFSEADYEARGPKFILTPADFDPGWTWDTTLTGIYTGVRYQYTNSDKNKTFTVKAGTEERLLTCNEPADNLTEATAIALASVNNANKGTTTMSLSMMARPGLIASDTIEIAGLKRLSGKYYVEEVAHSIGSGYKMGLKLRKVEPRIASPTAISSTVSEGG